MKLKLSLLLILLFPSIAYSQSIKMPFIRSVDNGLTNITAIDVNATNTVITFKSLIPQKGSWVQLSKAIYIQNSDGDDRYNYIKSEGITLAPIKTYATKDNEEVIFKVYFQKLKPGIKEINVVERAVPANRENTSNYFNYYNVSLTESRLTHGNHTKITDVVLSPPPPNEAPDTLIAKQLEQNMAPMMNQMYKSILDVQLKMYSDKEVLQKLATINKNYYDALIKAGFTEDAALKIITSKQLVALDGK